MQQLTHLLFLIFFLFLSSLRGVEKSTPPASYAALTASSKLQQLNISISTMPAGVWQHMFPAGKQLPNLLSLSIAYVRQFAGGIAQDPEGSRLVSCCPSLQYLEMASLLCSAELLAPLQGLSALQALHCSWGDATAEVVQAVCQLTGLYAALRA
jgi:hypothetical protein